MNADFIELIDAYKIDHRRQYSAGTEFVYSNFTARSSRIPDQNEVVFFGLQYFLERYLKEVYERSFFGVPRHVIVDRYRKMLLDVVGSEACGVEHIEALHNLGYLPLEFHALHEGTRVPLRVPMLTVENTHPEFFWLTNYIETMLSNILWLPCTSATTASRYRRLLDGYGRKTGGDPAFVDFQAHDFSFRGMPGIEAAALSGAAHLTSFTGTDTIPAIRLLQRYYDATGLVGGSVPATEHSVMCAGGMESERATFERLLQLYPTGIVSVVSDTWDLWEVITGHLPALKQQILARDGKLVIRPDSGDPVKIICGDEHAPLSSPQRRGVIESLWHIFGGTVNDHEFKVLDSHIGAIYGDSITIERAEEICKRLAYKGFASTNIVLGVGSFTYQHVTRDTYSHAIKATWAQVNGVGRALFKDPKTDDGVKRSARGRLCVSQDESGRLHLIDGLDRQSQAALSHVNLLQPVWRDGHLLKRTSLGEIRARLRAPQ